jgi:hypothetical protein
MTEQDTYESSPQGRQIADLLRRHAPPPVDPAAAAKRVVARLGNARPAGRLVALRWMAVAASVAAAVVITVVLTQPREPQVPADQPAAAQPDALPTVTGVRRERAYPEIVAMVRREGMIDAGLKDGLRVGDELNAAGGVKVRVTAIGVFDARISADGPISRGTELRAPVVTPAQVRAARYADFGGDPGAFLEFGVLVSALPLSEARMLGISDGQALRVDESIGSVLRGQSGMPQPTLAARLDLRAGDVILEVNGATVRTANDFANALGWSLDPQRLTIRILRNGKQLDLKL